MECRQADCWQINTQQNAKFPRHSDHNSPHSIDSICFPKRILVFTVLDWDLDFGFILCSVLVWRTDELRDTFSLDTGFLQTFHLYLAFCPCLANWRILWIENWTFCKPRALSTCNLSVFSRRTYWVCRNGIRAMKFLGFSKVCTFICFLCDEYEFRYEFSLIWIILYALASWNIRSVARDSILNVMFKNRDYYEVVI